MSFEYIFLAGFIGVLGYFVYRIIRYKGFKGAMFGAEILETFGEVSGSKSGFVSVSLKVHALSGPDALHSLVGLEVVARSGLSYQMSPMTLERSEAQKLISLLERAVAKAVI